ncbi:hypothetical protein [Microbacterium sp.]|uniref:hypothetical protein n=1 Tax=Microbacterium sp. TaxID=51671 RepID=UPI00333E2F76
MRKPTTGIGLVALLTVLLAACSPVPPNPRAVLEDKASTIDSAAQDLLEALDAAGLPGGTARGRIDGCQSQPAPGVAYRAGISVPVGDDLAGGFDALVEQLRASGWQPTNAYDGVEIDPAKPMGRFGRGDVTLDVKTGGFKTGTEEHGADGMVLGITTSHDCVRIHDGESFLDFEDMEKDIPPRA